MQLPARRYSNVIIRAVNQSLKQGGRLVVVEFAEGHPFGHLDKAERMTEEQIRNITLSNTNSKKSQVANANVL